MLHMRSNESVTNIFDDAHSQELFGIGKKKPKKEPYKPDEKTLATMRKRAVNILKEVFSKFGNPKGFTIFTKEDIDDWKENSSDEDYPPLGRYDVNEFTNGRSRDEKESKKFDELFEKIVDVIDIACKPEPFDIGSDGGDNDGGFFYLSIKEPKSNESYNMSTEGKSNESLFNDEIEQNNVLSLENALFSMEDDDASSFEDAAEESSGEDDFGGDDTGGGDGWGDDSGGDSGGDDGGWGDDSGGDDGWGDDTGDGGDDSGDGDGESSGIDVIDNNKGSSLNPFTQINHKIYTLDTLNALSNSIKNSIDLYNDHYADWSEVVQLNDLSEIVDEEKRSFMMQQNPENDIKLGLYLEQYKTIVQNISYRIKVLKSNNKA